VKITDGPPELSSIELSTTLFRHVRHYTLIFRYTYVASLSAHPHAHLSHPISRNVTWSRNVKFRTNQWRAVLYDFTILARNFSPKTISVCRVRERIIYSVRPCDKHSWPFSFDFYRRRRSIYGRRGTNHGRIISRTHSYNSYVPASYETLFRSAGHCSHILNRKRMYAGRVRGACRRN